VDRLVDQTERDVARRPLGRTGDPGHPKVPTGVPTGPFGHHLGDRPLFHGDDVTIDVAATRPPPEKTGGIAQHPRQVVGQHADPRVVGVAGRVQIERTDPVDVGRDVAAVDDHMEAVRRRRLPEGDLPPMEDPTQ
jgi:hypothetical protein